VKADQVLLLVVIALICGGVAGYISARFAKGGTDQTIITVRKLQFLDSSSDHQLTLEPGKDDRPRLILKDSTGKQLYELPPSFKLHPAGES
jgi:hypothetical protein